MLKFDKISFILIVVSILFACTTNNNYDAMLNSYLGASKQDIIAQFGRPSAVKIVNNTMEVLAYTKVDNVFVPSEFYTYNQGDELYGQDDLYSPFLSTYLFSNTPGSIGYEADYICKTLFLLKDNKVIAWRWQGNNCVDGQSGL